MIVKVISRNNKTFPEIKRRINYILIIFSIRLQERLASIYGLNSQSQEIPHDDPH